MGCCLSKTNVGDDGAAGVTFYDHGGGGGGASDGGKAGVADKVVEIEASKVGFKGVVEADERQDTKLVALVAHNNIALLLINVTRNVVGPTWVR